MDDYTCSYVFLENYFAGVGEIGGGSCKDNLPFVIDVGTSYMLDLVTIGSFISINLKNFQTVAKIDYNISPLQVHLDPIHPIIKTGVVGLIKP